jgi:hypothetical protein
MNPAQRQKILMVAAVAIAVVWLGDRLVVTPLTKAWKERSARILDLRKKVTQGSALLERESIIRKRWSGMETNTVSEELSIAESRVLKSFDRWSKDSDLNILSIKPQWRRNADDYMTLECRVDAFGDLGKIVRFLYEVEQASLALKVDSFEISPRDNTGKQLTLGLQVSALRLQTQEP